MDRNDAYITHILYFAIRKSYLDRMHRRTVSCRTFKMCVCVQGHYKLVYNVPVYVCFNAFFSYSPFMHRVCCGYIVRALYGYITVAYILFMHDDVHKYKIPTVFYFFCLSVTWYYANSLQRMSYLDTIYVFVVTRLSLLDFY